MKQPQPTRRLSFAADETARLTHYLFRYPAKFHPPVVRRLIQLYSREGHTILDPFCGSGTLLVEASTLGRNAIGLDIDPVATFVSRVKTLRPTPGALGESITLVDQMITPLERTARDYDRLQFEDISAAGYRSVVGRLSLRVPQIPNITHWFRRYVLIDLARIRMTIQHAPIPASHKAIVMLCFASMLRAASNADPVPVSGLEVTSHMMRRDALGRIINPFRLFRTVLGRALNGFDAFRNACKLVTNIRVVSGDAIELSARVRRSVDLVITSPPYHNAVDYYRRHMLEMYWLDLIENHDVRLALLPKYIGRARVLMSHPLVHGSTLKSQTAIKWEERLRRSSVQRANSFVHYMVSMQRTVSEIAKILRKGAPAIFVVGKSSWNGRTIPTTDLFREIADGLFEYEQTYWYPLKNRYMSYSRHNSASIDKEYVLVFRRTAKKAN